MDAIYRVDGNRVVTSPNAAGPWDPRHAARLGAGVAGGMGGRGDSDAGADADRARHHRPDAPGAGGAADARDRSAARGAQDPALRGQAVGRRRRRGRRHRAQDQDAGVDACRRTSRTCRSSFPDPIRSREETPDFSGSPFVTGISMRAARGRFGVPGPGAIWYRVDRPLVEGAAISQAMRAVVAADFCNGTSAVLDFREWTFINADLTVSFARQPVGEWILLDAESWIGPDGAGFAAARLADVKAISAAACKASSSRSDSKRDPSRQTRRRKNSSIRFGTV